MLDDIPDGAQILRLPDAARPKKGKLTSGPLCFQVTDPFGTRDVVIPPDDRSLPFSDNDDNTEIHVMSRMLGMTELATGLRLRPGGNPTWLVNEYNNFNRHTPLPSSQRFQDAILRNHANCVDLVPPERMVESAEARAALLELLNRFDASTMRCIGQMAYVSMSKDRAEKGELMDRWQMVHEGERLQSCLRALGFDATDMQLLVATVASGSDRTADIAMRTAKALMPRLAIVQSLLLTARTLPDLSALAPPSPELKIMNLPAERRPATPPEPPRLLTYAEIAKLAGPGFSPRMVKDRKARLGPPDPGSTLKTPCWRVDNPLVIEFLKSPYEQPAGLSKRRTQKT